ncbi:hypothetical protein MKY24_16725 [Paenibacillus sp. FSL P2-0322]|uniref:hypothetical protein n=1 Tax=Paenibacillus sp. FSL P2-0322 TaxID=2921628 RepID=UPI0030CBB029
MADFELIPFVRTSGTSRTGEGQSAWGDWQELKAPPGLAFNDRVLEKSWELLESRGRDHFPGWEFSEPTPVRSDLPEVTLPTRMKVRAHAKSPGGISNIGESGMAKIRVSGDYVKLS